MKSKYLFSVLFLSAIFSLAQEIDLPQPRGYINDFANLIGAEAESKLSELLSALEEKTTAEMAVVILESIAPYDIELYAVKLFEEWGIGKRGKDNGVLLLVALKERKIRIEVGYGLEGALPDALCKQIIEREIVPYFKKGEYEKGILLGVSTIVGLVGKEYGVEIKGVKRTLPRAEGAPSLLELFFSLIIFLLLFRIFGVFGIFFFPFGGYRGGYWSSGGGGFGGLGGFGGGLSGGGGASGGW